MQQQRRRPPMTISPVNNSNRPIRQTTRSSTCSMPSTVNQCFGCSQPIHNQFLSNVLDHIWHPECVRCFTCRCSLNEQCYSREGKLYCKDDFIKKYIHRCFACQNLVQSHELIRRIRAGRIYHAECFVCSKCKQTLQDDDISSLLKVDGEALNDLDCVCQTCLNPGKSSDEIRSLSNADEDKTTDSEISKAVNGKASPPIDIPEQKPPPTTNADIPQPMNDKSIADNHINMEVDELPPAIKPSMSPEKENSSSSSPSLPAAPITPPPKPTGRQSKVRQSTSSNGSKRSSAKSKATTPVSRQKQTTAKGRSPATRSKSSAVPNTTPPASSTVRTRSSNRRTTKSIRYRKRSFSSGSDEEETEDDEEEDDTDFTEEDNMQEDEQENARSSVVKSKPSTNFDEKKAESEPLSAVAPPPPPLPPPPTTTTNPSLISQAKMSEPLSLLSGLAANPMSISSIMKPDLTPNFMPTFPTPSQFLPPGFSLPPRLPIPQSSLIPSQSAPVPDLGNASDSDSLDHSSNSSQMDTSTYVEPARPTTSPKAPRQTTHKPSALSSLLEFGTLPPSNLNDIRSNNTSNNNPFPFPFVTPGPGVPFSPQAAAGMATFYRPPFGVPPSAMPLDMTQSTSNLSKKKFDNPDNDLLMSQNLLNDSSPSPKKKARKTKKNGIDGENGIDEDKSSSSSTSKKKKKLKTENGTTNDTDETKIPNGNNHSHNLLAQMGLMNNSFMPPPPPPPLSASSNGKSPTPNSQLAAMYNMAPHFAAYNAFSGAFNPAFAAYASGYPAPYGFHPAFGAPSSGQPFPFMPPTSALNNTSTTDDKSSSIVVPETRPPKSRSRSNTGGEKKKAARPRSKKKSIVPTASTDLPVPTEGELSTGVSLSEMTSQTPTTPESTSTPTKRRISGTESDDFDEQLHSQKTNGKSGYESDGSVGDGDRSLNTIPSTSSSTAPDKKGARTTIKPQQLDVLCKAYDCCSKPNKPQREQLVAETGLSIRVIQVWFQNKRSKERKGKTPKDKETPLDDDEAGDDSQLSPSPAISESIPVTNNET